VSVVTAVEAAVEKVFHEVETAVAEVDGEALKIARQVIADAKAAESRAVTLAEDCKTQIEALVAHYEPEIAQAVISVAEKLLSDITALFGAAA